jgi:hypothetical protein
MGITLEQKLDCLTEDEYDAIEEIVDIILRNRMDKKSCSDTQTVAYAQHQTQAKQPDETGESVGDTQQRDRPPALGRAIPEEQTKCQCPKCHKINRMRNQEEVE